MAQRCGPRGWEAADHVPAREGGHEEDEAEVD